MNPSRLSHELRTDPSSDLRRRRTIAALGLTATAALGVVALYQLGLIRKIPEPPLRRLDAAKVDASDEAYSYFSTPDSVLGIGSYAVTIALEAMDGADRARRRPWLPIALLAKVVLDVGQAARLTRDQWTKHRAFCIWCLAAAGATFAMLPLAIPEARRALRHVSGR